jgi:hypothetical protein
MSCRLRATSAILPGIAGFSRILLRNLYAPAPWKLVFRTYSRLESICCHDAGNAVTAIAGARPAGLMVAARS